MGPKNVTFRLKENRKPVSWQLPLANVFLPRFNEVTQMSEDKAVHYMPGAPSIWVEDYKGDKKETPEVIFEDGELEVSPTNVLLLDILRKHRWFNVHYEEVNEEADALVENSKYDNIQKALELVDDADDMKVRANALSLLGRQAFGYTAIKCRAELKKKAFENADEVIRLVSEVNFESKYLVSLAFLKGIIKTSNGDTAVVWSENNNTIINLAVGEDSIEEMTNFLSNNDDASKFTLQKIGELTSKVVTAKQDTTQASATVSDAAAKILEEKDAEIEALKAQLASKTAPIAEEVQAPKEEVVEEIVEEKQEEVVEDEAPAKSLEELQKEYTEKIGVLPPNKKNDPVWILSKLTAQ